MGSRAPPHASVQTRGDRCTVIDQNHCSTGRPEQFDWPPVYEVAPDESPIQRAGRFGLAGLFGSLRSRGLYCCPLAGSVAVAGGPEGRELAPLPVVAGFF
jgi:hypothetical protein